MLGYGDYYQSYQHQVWFRGIFSVRGVQTVLLFCSCQYVYILGDEVLVGIEVNVCIAEMTIVDPCLEDLHLLCWLETYFF